METISFFVLVLLSLVGYSAGAVSKAGKHVDLKPQLIDLILVLIIWTGAIYSRIDFDINKWILIPIWVIIGIIIGILSIYPRNLSEEKASSKEELKVTSKNLIKRLWQNWKNFSRRMGSFQSRIILSLFFFIIISPGALVAKIISDPLRIKLRSNKSYWLSKREVKNDLEQFRRQF